MGTLTSALGRGSRTATHSCAADWRPSMSSPPLSRSVSSLPWSTPGRCACMSGRFSSIPLVLLTGKLVGLYDRDPHVLRKTTIDEAPAILYLSVVYALGAWLCEAVLFHGELVRGQVFGLLLLMFTLTALGRDRRPAACVDAYHPGTLHRPGDDG